mgnify:FL=1
MINALIGELVSVREGSMIVRSNNIEYILLVSNQSASRFASLDKEERKLIRVLTSLQVREDSLTLYGFYDETEREAFGQLQTVSGIGPKQALKILGGISVRHLAEALDSGNVKTLATIPGIGPKTAQKMVLALRNVLVLDEPKTKQTTSRGAVWADVVNALVEMGFERRRSEEVVGELEVEFAKEIGELGRHSAEELLFRHALKNLS